MYSSDAYHVNGEWNNDDVLNPYNLIDLGNLSSVMAHLSFNCPDILLSY